MFIYLKDNIKRKVVDQSFERTCFVLLYIYTRILALSIKNTKKYNEKQVHCLEKWFSAYYVDYPDIGLIACYFSSQCYFYPWSPLQIKSNG